MAETSTATRRSMDADIISSLPNSLLCHILKFLPTFDAVGTGFLSRRWRHLWKDLQVFNFDDRCIRSMERFISFVDAVLYQRPEIQKFSLSCYWRFDDPIALQRWMHAAVGSYLQELNLKFFNYESLIRDCVVDSIFRCDSLVSLCLVGGFNLSNIPSVHLPLLKNLKLARVVSVDLKLISSCPSLEDLCFIFSGEHYRNINLISPSLKRLRLKEARDSAYSIINEIRIDAPNLEFLHMYLVNSRARTLVISDFPNMMEASFIVPPKAEHVDWVPKLLQALSKIKKLELGGPTTKCLVKAPNLHFPEFRCLSQLRICFTSFNSGVLIKLLCCCPKLQVLQIYNSRHSGNHSSWTQPASVPSCVMSHLNILQFRRYPDSSEEREFFAYILQSALVLKTITICTDIGSYEKEKEHILNEISALPRGSSICRVEEYNFLKWR